MRWRCGDCKRQLDDVRSAPMLHDELWHAVARGRRLLCHDCLENRMQRVLGRPLHLHDLRPCRFNVMTGHVYELAPANVVIAMRNAHPRLDPESAIAESWESLSQPRFAQRAWHAATKMWRQLPLPF